MSNSTRLDGLGHCNLLVAFVLNMASLSTLCYSWSLTVALLYELCLPEFAVGPLKDLPQKNIDSGQVKLDYDHQAWSCPVLCVKY